VDEF